jgi:hypothetical protein
MTIGPEPMRRIVWRSSRRGMEIGQGHTAGKNCPRLASLPAAIQ